MSLDQHDEEPDVSDLERALRGLVPQSSPASHDRLMFAAGRQDEHARTSHSRRLWMCAAAIPSVAAAVLGFLLVEARTTVARLELALNDRSQPAVKVVANGIADSAVAAERPLAPSAPERTEKDAPIAHRERLPSPFSEQSATPAALTNPDRPRYLELRNRVLRFGVEALADGSPRTTLSAPPEASPSPATSRELRELYLQNPDRQPAG